MAAPVLALASEAHEEAPFWRRSDSIETLPYIDTLSAEEKAAVDKVIQEEMRRSTKRAADYLAEVPPPPPTCLQGHPLLLTELTRIKAGQPMLQPDNERLGLPQPPLSRRNDVAAWRTVLENAHSQLEHQYNRLLNLELLLQYGPPAWQAHLTRLELAARRLEEEVAATKARVGGVNSQRKVAQSAAGERIAEHESEWRSALAKTSEIAAACAGLEAEIEQLRRQLPTRPEDHATSMEVEAGGGATDAAINGQLDGALLESAEVG